MQSEADNASEPPSWYLASSHGLVLFYIAANPEATIAIIAGSLGITERRVISIVKDLAGAGLVSVERHGRRNSYQLEEGAHFLHPTMAHLKVADFVRMLQRRRASDSGRSHVRAADGDH